MNRMIKLFQQKSNRKFDEYLLAKKNEGTFAHDAHGMAAQESGWLTQAAECDSGSCT